MTDFAPLSTLHALEASLNRLKEGHTIPIRLRPNVDQKTVDREFNSELRAQMYLAGL